MSDDRKKSGLVFNIQKFSVHDGPGIRTLVFLKGCPLSCRWCSNPESQSFDPELAYNAGRCIGLSHCVYCAEVCAPNAVSRGEDDKIRIDRSRCRECSRPCVGACPSGALITYGVERTVDEILRRVEEDALFYSRSSGGMTLSGGEPLAQGDFTPALLREAKRRRINTAMETSGYAPWETLREACSLLDSILFDLKILDPAVHQAHTGVGPERIIDNFRRMTREFPDLPVLARTPVVPGFNDNEEALLPIAELIGSCRAGVTWELLPYHRLGTQKYLFLQKDSPMKDVRLSNALFSRLQKNAGEALAGAGKILANRS
jgi:pyruvate formate lyase activating enzyme